MRVKFKVLGTGHASFHSNKTNRDYQRVRLMGFVYDFTNEEIPCTADMGFDVPLAELPKPGDEILLSITEFTTRSSMAELTFSKIEPLAVSSVGRK